MTANGTDVKRELEKQDEVRGLQLRSVTLYVNGKTTKLKYVAVTTDKLVVISERVGLPLLTT